MAAGDRELEQLLQRVDRAVERMAAAPRRAHPDIAAVCVQATAQANAVRAARSPRERRAAIRTARQWLASTSNQFLFRLNRRDAYPPNDLDRLIGCLTRVEVVVGRTPPVLQRLRAAVGRILGVPTGHAP